MPPALFFPGRTSAGGRGERGGRRRGHSSAGCTIRLQWIVMAEVVATKVPGPFVQCVREVRVGVPLERLAVVQWFYVELLGLRPWPDEAQLPGGWGVGHPQRGVFMQFRHDPEVDSLRRRFTLIVPALDELEVRLTEAKWPFARHRGLSAIDQWLLVADPVGHLIEVRQAQECF